MTSPVFSGSERVSFFEPFARLTRLGRPAELSVSDARRVEEALQRNDREESLRYLEALEPLYYAIITTYLEWASALHALIHERKGIEAERAVAADAFSRWQSGLDAYPDFERPVIELLSSLLDPEKLGAETVLEFRNDSAATNTYPSKLNEEPLARLASCRKSTENCKFTEATAAFQRYMRAVCERHDLIGHYVSSFGAALSAHFDEAFAINVMQEGLETCAVLEQLWQFVESRPPEELALLLAEHLRSHFSGPDRQGEVQIIEEPDRFRLVLNPCGSGGAMRRRSINALNVLAEPRPETWFRRGEVPIYCAHCAKNELTSIRRIGYPAWVTEFNPDPDASCGWTIYKDPADIPEEYYSRLGLNKPEGGINR